MTKYERMTAWGLEIVDIPRGDELVRAIDVNHGRFQAQYRWGEEWITVCGGSFGHPIDFTAAKAAIDMAKSERSTRCKLGTKASALDGLSIVSAEDDVRAASAEAYEGKPVWRGQYRLAPGQWLPVCNAGGFPIAYQDPDAAINGARYERENFRRLGFMTFPAGG